MKISTSTKPLRGWRIVCVIQFGILLAIYTYLGLTPAPQNDVPIIINDLFMHFFGYFVASFSFTLLAPHWRLLPAAAALILYSIAIEIAQHFNPPRTFSFADIIANAAGTLLGLMCISGLRRRWAWIECLLHGRLTQCAADSQ